MKAKLLVLSLCGMIFSPGCASIFCGAKKTVNISSTPSGASFTVRDRHDKEVVTGVTPTKVRLKRGSGYFRRGSYRIEFQKDGFEKTIVSAVPTLETGWYIFGNFIFPGSIGWFIVDPLTGAMWNLKDVHAVLSPQPPTEVTAPPKDTPAKKDTSSKDGYEYSIKKDAAGNFMKDANGAWILELGPKKDAPPKNPAPKDGYEYSIKKDAAGNFMKDADGAWNLELVPKKDTQ